MADAIVQLRCGVKNDAWGKKGRHSMVAQLWSQTPGQGSVDDSQAYSEMTIGTSPFNPSSLLLNGQLLGEYLTNNPQLIGKSVLDRWGPDTPFLCRVLSFSKALPLQIHPDLKLAQRFHEEDPKKFGDVKHQPEIAIALSKFELFAGFMPLDDIKALFTLRPLEKFVPPMYSFTDDYLRQVCRNLLCAKQEELAEIITELQSIPESQFGAYPYIPGLLDRLSKQNAEFDNGVLVAVLLMNHLIMGPGDAVCIPSDSIHAYVEGDIMECMAWSESMVQTGFCPAPGCADVELLSKALNFVPHDLQAALLPRCKSDKGMNGKTDVYAPQSGHFSVLGTCLSSGENETHKAILGPSLMIVVKGQGFMRIPGNQTIELRVGYVFFVGQGVALDFSTDRGIAFYRAYTEQ